MQYSIQHDKQSDICTVQVTGQNRRPDDSLELQQFAIKYQKDTGCFRFLFDMTEAIIIGNTTDAYNTGITPQRLGVEAYGPHRIALVYSDDLSKHKFMEEVLNSHGYNVRIFDDMTAATDWLITNNS